MKRAVKWWLYVQWRQLKDGTIYTPTMGFVTPRTLWFQTHGQRGWRNF